MPATRRKAAAPTSAQSQSSQSTLSFNNKPSRITKANAIDQAKQSKSKFSEPAEKAITSISIPEPEAAIEIEIESKSTDVIIHPSPSKSTTPKRKSKRKSDGLEDVRAKAAKISDAQIKKYWKAEEDSRLAPRGMHLTMARIALLRNQYIPIHLCSPLPIPLPPSYRKLIVFFPCITVHQSTVPLHEKILRHFDLSSQYGPCIGIARLNRWLRASRLDLNPPIEVLAVLLREEAKGDKRDTGRIAYIDELGGGKGLLRD
jgi:DNA polymerase delta subunit 4